MCRAATPDGDLWRAVWALWEAGAFYWPDDTARDDSDSACDGDFSGRLQAIPPVSDRADGTALWPLRAALMRALGVENADFAPRHHLPIYTATATD